MSSVCAHYRNLDQTCRLADVRSLSLSQATDTCTEVPEGDYDICAVSCLQEHVELLVELIFGCVQTAVCRWISGNDEWIASTFLMCSRFT